MADVSMATFTHRVRLHFRSVANTAVSFYNILNSTQTVLGTYGIKVEMASGQSVKLSNANASKYSTVDGACKWNITSGELYDLQQMSGSFFGNSEIFVFHVNELANGVLGCGGHAPYQPACIVGSRASRWDTAHEICHVLLGSSFAPIHSPDVNNLMHATASSYSRLPILTTKQVEQIKRSPYCVKIAGGFY